MATVTVTEIKTVTQIQETQEYLDKDVREAAKNALSETSVFWKGVEGFLDFLRETVSHFLCNTLMSQFPFRDGIAKRISVTVTEFCFTVLGTMLQLLKVVFGSHKFWQAAHTGSMNAWKANENRGLLAQIYAYSKKMAAYFLEILMQCIERAIKAHGLKLLPDEKESVNKLLNELLP